MKARKIILFILLLVSGAAFVSCGDTEPVDPALLDYIGNDDDNGGNNNNNQPIFKVDFNNQTFTATNYVALVTGGSITVSGMRPNGSNVTFLVNGITPGTYPANDSDNNFISYQPAGTGYAYVGWHPTDENANTGSVVITSVNAQSQTISGTFHFTGYWSNDEESIEPIEFTNGVFTNIPYVTENLTGDTFYARVNGVEFVDTDILVFEIEIMEQEFISVVAMDANDRSIGVNISSSFGVGTYPVSQGGTAQVHYEIPGEVGAFATSGSVTITEKTATRIKGTFNATVNEGGDTYQITQGEFDVEY